MTFEEDSYVQIVAPNGDYRYGYVAGAEEQGQHLTICMHEEGDSKLEYEKAADVWNGQRTFGEQYGLSSRELRILELLCEGLATSDIAQQVNVRPGTVRSYLRTLRLKLRATDRSQLLIVAHAIVKSLHETK